MQYQGKNLLLEDWIQPILNDAMRHGFKDVHIQLGVWQITLEINPEAKSSEDHKITIQRRIVAGQLGQEDLLTGKKDLLLATQKSNDSGRLPG